MKILFICTAHNSLSQSLYLALSRSHEVSIEYALSDDAMTLAVALANPDLIICPFLTTLVPKEIYDNYLTLIVHPGPPGDAGPSALDWVLLGDDGTVDDPNELLTKLDKEPCTRGRSQWGITVLQATEEFDAGPVWGFATLPVDIDEPSLTKSALYRGLIPHAINATVTAISRIQAAARCRLVGANSISLRTYPPSLAADPRYAKVSVSDNQPFSGGRLHHRPLLKAAQRDVDIARHTAQQISRRIRCADSQPGALSKVFGKNLYIYGGIIEENVEQRTAVTLECLTTRILGVRNEAICLATCDGQGIWITHVRRPKTKHDKALFPKVPAMSGLLDLSIISSKQATELAWPMPANWTLQLGTFQEVWVDFQTDANLHRTAYLHFDFYNGAMSTRQCSHLIDAMDYIIAQHTDKSPLQAVVLMGGQYFSNGIALNVIEATADPANESWMNINRIDDVVHYLLHEFPQRNILTIAAVRGNAAAGGVALATACDIVVAGSNVVLNPAYKTVGLYGSEYHQISYFARCGKINATKMLRSMTPMSPAQAQSLRLVDYIFPGTGEELDDHIRSHIVFLLKPGIIKQGAWKRGIDLSPAALAKVRAAELAQMSLDFWSARSERYHSRRWDFVRKVKPASTPLRFATHRRLLDPSKQDEEETDDFDSVHYWQHRAEELLVASLRSKLLAEFESEAQRVQIAASKKEMPVVTAATVEPMRVMDKAPSMSVRERRGSTTIFSCYYQPPMESPPTPPESPMAADAIAMQMMPLIS